MPAPQAGQDTIAGQIIATANQAGGSGTKALPHVEEQRPRAVAGQKWSRFRQTLTSLGAARRRGRRSDPCADDLVRMDGALDSAVIAITFALPHESRDFLRLRRE